MPGPQPVLVKKPIRIAAYGCSTACYICRQSIPAMLLNSDEVSFDFGALILRASAGGTLFLQHGWPKLLSFSERAESFYDPIGLGHTFSLILILVAEVLCSAMVVLGLWTRLTTIPIIIGMAVAAFMANGDAPFAKQELAFLYMMAFIAIFLMGSGRYSLDRLSFR